jgi:hypothetical protein
LVVLLVLIVACAWYVSSPSGLPFSEVRVERIVTPPSQTGDSSRAANFSNPRTELLEREDRGVESPSATAAASPQPLPTEAPAAAAALRVQLPLVFVEPDPSLNLTEKELADLDRLREEFIEAIGGPDQDPSTPDYYQRWERARTVFDGRLKGWFGSGVYLSLQSSAAAALAGSTSPGNR